MKFLLFPLLVLLPAFSSHAQAINCRRFKTGTFVYAGLPVTSYTVREDTLQTSYYQQGGSVTWTVAWRNECEFDLLFVKADSRETDFKQGDRIAVVITSVDETCYTFRATFYPLHLTAGQVFPPGTMCFKPN